MIIFVSQNIRMIKATVYILCIYILLLAVMPCADMHECATTDKTECVLMQAHNDDSHENCMDRCSPLCVCNCCMAAVAQIKEVHFDFVDRLLPAENNTLYLFGVSHEMTKLVLQPPERSDQSFLYFLSVAYLMYETQWCLNTIGSSLQRCCMLFVVTLHSIIIIINHLLL